VGQYRDRAIELFKQGYNCSQAVVAAFCDETGMDFETALKISSSFGGGMGRLREVCGAVSGMFMVAGMKYGYTDPKDRLLKTGHYKLIQEMAEKFINNNRSVICRELLGQTGKIEGHVPEVRTDEYYKKRPCIELVGDAAEIMHQIIQQKNLNK
jgi:C_GCAxxG_C_C family probable redox protein